MGQGLGHIQKRILETLETIDERYITKENRPLRWLWMSILVISVYHPQQIEGEKKRDWDWRYEKNEHRRCWESVRGLEARGLIQTRVVKPSDIGLKAKFGGTTRWMEIRLK